MDEMRKALMDAGFDVPLFQCNPPDEMKNGMLHEFVSGGKFRQRRGEEFCEGAQDPADRPADLQRILSRLVRHLGPAASLGKPENYLPNLKLMLDMGASFSIYMAHGGTTFGLWSGCDRPFKPDTSSYDYDAPISEAGWPTPKFYADARVVRQISAARRNPAAPCRRPIRSSISRRSN